jgi:hypothetical protein
VGCGSSAAASLLPTAPERLHPKTQINKVFVDWASLLAPSKTMMKKCACKIQKPELDCSRF